MSLCVCARVWACVVTVNLTLFWRAAMWFDSFTSTSVFSAACLVAKFFEDLTKVTYQEPVNYSN